jgi:dual oxidase
MDFSRRDLAALNIMRGRDNGLPDYNTVRRYFQLPPITNWSQINPSLYARKPEIFDQLSDLYENNLNNIDAYVGGMVESEYETGRPGPLFRAIIQEQFVRIRDADRFWFENTQNGVFSQEEIEEIRKIRLYDILVNATSIPADAIQKNVFLFRESDPCPQPGQLSSAVLEPCLILAGWNYFHGSELSYILVILLLTFIPMGIKKSFLIYNHLLSINFFFSCRSFGLWGNKTTKQAQKKIESKTRNDEWKKL